MNDTALATVGQLVYLRADPLFTAQPRGGMVVEVIEPYVDPEIGEMVGRRYVTIHSRRDQGGTHVLTTTLDEDRVSADIAPFSAGVARQWAREIFKDLSGRKGRIVTQELALAHWADRLFTLAVTGGST